MDYIKTPEDGNTWLYDASIDTEAFLKHVLGAEIHDLFDEEFDEGAGWDHDEQVKLAIEKREGVSYFHNARGNVYNNENDFSDIFTYSVYIPLHNNSGDWLYSDDAYVAVCLHQGGDVRGNYGGVRVFKADNLVESGFLDWTLGWYCEDLSEDENEKLSTGYSSCPTSELESTYGDKGVWKDGAFIIKHEDRELAFFPDLHLNGC